MYSICQQTKQNKKIILEIKKLNPIHVPFSAYYSHNDKNKYNPNVEKSDSYFSKNWILGSDL